MNKKVKNLIGVALVLAAVIIPLSLTNGCASITSALSNTNSTAITAIRLAANTGTAYALQHKPEWKPLFQTAHDDLGALLAAGSLDLSQLQTISRATRRALSSATRKSSLMIT
jgi:hypothetical protein